MKKSYAWAVCALAAMTTASNAAAQSTKLTADEARQIAVDAYVYGYPLVTIEYTRRAITNVEKVEGSHAPMGQLARLRQYPTPAFREVTAPNADTLYVSGFVDVGQEPWILSLPDAHDRYYLFPMLDAWTNVFQVPGKRTTGTAAQTYAITGPGWTGTLPGGVTEYKSPTALVWFIGRIYCTGTPEDYAAVHKMEDEIALVPLSAYGKPYTPPAGKVDPSFDAKTPTREQVNALDVAAYFDLMARLMKDNPPAAADAPIVKSMARLGIEPGKPFDLAKLDPEIQQALKSVPKQGVEKILGHFKDAGELINGWTFTSEAGEYGVDYLQRAFVTYIGLGANRPQDAVYPTSQVDAQGQPYSGAKKYIMHFDKGQMPPVDGFWSLTMYDANYFFVANPLNRYTLSQRNKFNANADGSVDLYIQHDNPGPAKEANWLPAPQDKFVLMLRLYWPKQSPPSIIDGTWKPPGVHEAK
jgi:hypothetical protein